MSLVALIPFPHLIGSLETHLESFYFSDVSRSSHVFLKEKY